MDGDFTRRRMMISTETDDETDDDLNRSGEE